MKRVLVACESSGIVREAFRIAGHDAYSCDILPSERPGQHYQDRIEYVLQYDKEWDLLIAHPPCRYLAVSGARWFNQRERQQRSALLFVQWLMNLDIPRICIENPISVISSRIRRPDQIIQPYQFGDDASKATCLWLKGLPRLRPTKSVMPRIVNGKKRWANQTDSGQNKLAPSETRSADRARTYQGIADAMATQWSAFIASGAAYPNMATCTSYSGSFWEAVAHEETTHDRSEGRSMC